MNRQMLAITARLAPTVTSMGYELLGCQLVGGSGSKKLQVFIDKEETGINVDDCAAVSHQISAILDVEDLVSGEYRLEVSSPGWERPLFEPQHYRRFVGEHAFVKLYDALDGRKNFTGVILSVEGETIIFESDTKTFTFNFEQIQKGHLVPEDE